MTQQIERFGWRPDTPDHRDLMFRPAIAVLPPSVDLRPKFKWTPFDQGQLGSCTANAISAAVVYAEQQEAKDTTPGTVPSRLAIYYGERDLEGTVASDAGAEIRDGLKVVAKTGYMDEKLWPYDIARFRTAPPAPPIPAHHRRAEHIYRYHRVTVDAAHLKACLAEGFPVVVGITVYDSFFNAPNGDVPMPEPGEAVAGGHAILCMGYDDTSRRWRLLNSWGEDWGDHGFFTLPYGYLDSDIYGGDYWTIRKES